MSLHIDKTELFHVHTYRCKHAEDIPDEAYVHFQMSSAEKNEQEHAGCIKEMDGRNDCIK